MKIIISATEKSLDAMVDARFGRAKTFVLYDSESGDVTFLDSPSSSSAQGAGVQAAHLVVQSGAEALLTGHCGPKAFKALQAAGIAVYVNVTGTIRKAIKEFLQGSFKPAEAADVESHWL